MDELLAKQAVGDGGRLLLSEGLVARTWGNVSCRLGATDAFAITPSGLAYDGMGADDVVVFHMQDGTWEGTRKPSSEKGVHAAAYRRFPEAGFVIHTHQTYASALGIAGFDTLSLKKADEEALGGLALAGYGLPGTKRLTGNVTAALDRGAHTVLMAHHGALIVGKDLPEAFRRSKLLESLCQAACKGQPNACEGDAARLDDVTKALEGIFPHVAYSVHPAAVAVSRAGKTLHAQLDDMAQMIGPRLVTVAPEKDALTAALNKYDAVLVKGLGAVCRAQTATDTAALLLLTEKACIAALHAGALGVSGRLSALDTAVMRFVYLNKYQKKIAK